MSQQGGGPRNPGARWGSKGGSRKTGGGVGRVMFMGNSNGSLWNSYRPGAGVGALNPSVRRALQRRASIAPGTMEKPHQFALCCVEKFRK